MAAVAGPGPGGQGTPSATARMRRLRVTGTAIPTVTDGARIRLLRSPAPSPERIAEVVTRVLWRKEAARIYKWHKATGTFPPRRSRPDTS